MAKREKRTFLEFAHELLDKDKIDNFLDFIQFLKNNQLVKESQLTLTKSTSYSTMIHYTKDINGKICALNLNSIKRYKPDGSWSIAPNNIFFNAYENYVTDEKLQEFIINSINFIKCRGCDGSNCNGGGEHFGLGKDNLTIFGKNLKNVCNGSPLLIISPSGEALELAKKLVLTTKDIIIDISTNKT